MKWTAGLFTADARALALYRMSFGVWTLCDLYFRLAMPLGIYWYTDSSVEPASVLDVHDSPHGWSVHRLLFARTSLAWQQAVFAAHALVAVGFTLGVSQWFSPLLWLATVSLSGRSDYFNDGSDKLARNLSLINCFLPLTSVWSIRALLRGSSPTHHRRGLGIGLLKLQQIFMYVAVVVNRFAEEPAWHWHDGSAMYYIMSSTFGVTSMGHALSSYPRLCYALSLLTNVHELLIAAMFVVQPPLGLALTVLLHLGISFAVYLPQFHTLAILSVLVFALQSTPTQSIQSTSIQSTQSTSIQSTSIQSTSIQSTQSKRKTQSRVDCLMKQCKRVLAAALLLYMVFNFLAVDMRLIPSLDDGNVGQGLRFSQGWVMFGQVGRSAEWWQLVGSVTAGNGTASELASFDVFDVLANGAWTPAQSFVDSRWLVTERPDEPRAFFHSWRLERFFSKASYWPKATSRRRLARLLAAACEAVRRADSLPDVLGGAQLHLSLVCYSYRIRAPLSNWSLPEPRFQFSTPHVHAALRCL